MRRLLVPILLILLAAPALPKDKPRPAGYRGKVYQEIRVDDRGILLVDTLGNETFVGEDIGDIGEGGFSEPAEPSAPGIAIVDLRNGAYTDTLDGINRIGGSVTIDENELVVGEVTVLGNATIKGRVNGSVTATGKVRIASTGIVEGNVTGSSVIEESGSQVGGRVIEQRIGFPIPEPDWERRRERDATAAVIVGLIWLGLQLAIAAVLALLFPKATDRLRDVYQGNIFKALVVGFLIEISLLPAFVVLVITIIGIPVALIALPLSLVAAGFLGFSAFCLFISDYVKAKNATVEESRLTKIAVGFAVLQVPAAGFFLGFIVGSEAMSIIFGIVSGILFFIVFTASLGAAFVTRFGSRDYVSAPRPAPVNIEVHTTA